MYLYIALQFPIKMDDRKKSLYNKKQYQAISLLVIIFKTFFANSLIH